MVKKKFDFRKLVFFGGIPTALFAIIGAIVVCSKTITVYAEIPKEVEQVKTDVTDVKEYIHEQRMANKLMEQMVEKKERILSQDGKFFWNEDTKKWEKIK